MKLGQRLKKIWSRNTSSLGEMRKSRDVAAYSDVTLYPNVSVYNAGDIWTRWKFDWYSRPLKSNEWKPNCAFIRNIKRLGENQKWISYSLSLIPCFSPFWHRTMRLDIRFMRNSRCISRERVLSTVRSVFPFFAIPHRVYTQRREKIRSSDKSK